MTLLFVCVQHLAFHVYRFCYPLWAELEATISVSGSQVAVAVLKSASKQ